MLNTKCFDNKGNIIRFLTQWDLNVGLFIKKSEFPDTFKEEDFNEIEFHFCNKNSSESFILSKELITLLEEEIKIFVPNILLQESLPVILYICDITHPPQTDVGRRVFLSLELPVRPRPKPQDYVYEETGVFTYRALALEMLQEAKDSGKFDGAPGEKGDAGKDGYTPVKGVDYWTEDDKAEIKSYVDEAILGGAW